MSVLIVAAALAAAGGAVLRWRGGKMSDSMGRATGAAPLSAAPTPMRAAISWT